MISHVLYVWPPLPPLRVPWHTVLYLSCYIPNNVSYVFHLCEPFDVSAGEEEAVLYVAEYGVCESLCDAVFRFYRIAYGDAAVAVLVFVVFYQF